MGNWLEVGEEGGGLPAKAVAVIPERCEEKGLDESSGVPDGEGGSLCRLWAERAGEGLQV